MYKNYEIKIINAFSDKEAVFMKNTHYIKSLPRGCHYLILLFIDNKLSGIAGYGSPVGRRVYDVHGVKTLELKRFSLDNRCKKNTGSWLLAKCHKWLKQNTEYEKIISYADPEQGHEGTLYKASNFQYYGKQKYSTKYVEFNNRRIYIRNLYNGSKNNEEALRLYQDKKLKYTELPKKHIFIYNLINR